MARAIFAGKYGGNLQLEIVSGWNKPDYEKNRSVVNIGVRLIANGYVNIYGATQSLLKIKIDGREVGSYTVDASIGPGQAIDLKSADFVVDHNSDGTPPPGYISAELNIGFLDYSWAAVGEYVHLQTIPRASTIKAQDGIIGESVNISITRHSNTFKHAIKCAWYGKITVIANGIDTDFAWEIPKGFCNDIPNSESGWGILIAETYSGNQKIGEKSTTFTATVPNDIKPNLTGVTLTDTNTAAARIVPEEQDFISVLSNIKVDFGQAAGAYGSTITSYHAEIVGKRQSTNKNGGTLGIMDYDGVVTIRASVTDSRGRASNVIEKQINVIEYFAPVLNFDVVRSGANSSTLTITRNAKIAPLIVSGNQKNKMTLSFKVAPVNSENYVNDTGPAAGTWTTISSLMNSNANLQGTYASDTSWKIAGVLEDSFTSTPFQAVIGTEEVVESLGRDRVGFGKIAERPNAIDSAWDIYVNNQPIQQHALTAGNPAKGWIEIVGETPPNKSGFAWGVISKFFSRFSANGVFSTFFSAEKEALQTWTSHDGGAHFGRYRSYYNGEYGAFKAVGIDNFYPIGSIYQSTEATNPATFMGGTWERFGNGKTLIAVDEADGDFSTVMRTGGEKTHVLTIEEMPSHTHRQYVSANNGNDSIRKDWDADGSGKAYDQGMETGRTGGNKPHNNLQPYVTIYRWRRIA